MPIYVCCLERYCILGQNFFLDKYEEDGTLPIYNLLLEVKLKEN